MGIKGLKHISETLSDAMNAILSNDVIFFPDVCQAFDQRSMIGASLKVQCFTIFPEVILIKLLNILACCVVFTPSYFKKG